VFVHLRHGLTAVGVLACLVPAMGQEPLPVRVDVKNQSRRVIREAYVAPSAEGDWGAERLQGHPLAPGASITLGLPGTCGPHDLLFVAEGGTELEAEEVEVCPGEGRRLVIVLKDRGLEKQIGDAETGQ
jgi:hypothetical protein